LTGVRDGRTNRRTVPKPLLSSSSESGRPRRVTGLHEP